MHKSKSAPIVVQREETVQDVVASEIVIQPDSQPTQVQGNYQPASVTISGGSGHTVNVGQRSPTIRQPTLPQRLTEHPIGYWLVHLLIALAAILLWEGAKLLFKH
jgi:hypothetical protein